MPKYYPVMGLEVHAQLSTVTKMFCSCKVEVGAPPNTHVCPICLALPGALPVPNKQAVDLAIKLGLALNCEIDSAAMWTRKNYFYPDLPKGYQITQTGGLPVYDHPICRNGWLEITLEDGTSKRVGINRIHMEEDAGKLIHDLSTDGSHFDANRCGTPLCEIVTEPDLRSSQEAYLYLEKLKQILEYTEVCDANMEKGNLRCDANVSIRPAPDAPLGIRAEIKNLNSFHNVQKAIDAEILLQSVTLDAGRQVEQCTKRFDPNSGKTSVIRSKEDAHDYRYFPEPDLVRLVVTADQVQTIKQNLPELPDAKRARFVTQYEITPYDANVLTLEKGVGEWFDKAAVSCKNPKLLANWVISELLRELKEREKWINDNILPPEYLAQMVNLIHEGVISGKIGKIVFAEMLNEGKAPGEIIQEKALVQISDSSAIEAILREIIASNGAQWQEFCGGKAALRGFFVGQAMKKSGGKANPAMLNSLLDSLAASGYK